jgi:DNA invertase Pin-like site-specific DNA recombinase
MSSNTTGQVVGYVRVSAADQNEARQLEAVGEVDRLFSEKVSGENTAERAAPGVARVRASGRQGAGEVAGPARPLDDGSALDRPGPRR